MTTGNIQRPVARRKVFYIPGYDPIPPRRYRELYRTEGAEQAEISGYKIGLEAKSDSADFGWKVAAQMDGQTTIADIDVLVWSDRTNFGATHDDETRSFFKGTRVHCAMVPRWIEKSELTDVPATPPRYYPTERQNWCDARFLRGR